MADLQLAVAAICPPLAFIAMFFLWYTSPAPTRKRRLRREREERLAEARRRLFESALRR